MGTAAYTNQGGDDAENSNNFEAIRKVFISPDASHGKHPNAALDRLKTRIKVLQTEGTQEAPPTELSTREQLRLQTSLAATLKEIQGSPEKTSLYANKLRQASLKDIRTSLSLMKSGEYDPSHDENKEMEHRLAMYTTPQADGGLKLDYTKFNNAKLNHEKKVGLGDTLPRRFQKIAIKTKDGKWAVGIRDNNGVVDKSGEKRIGYKNEKTGLYLASHTGDIVYVLNPQLTDTFQIEKAKTAEKQLRKTIIARFDVRDRLRIAKRSVGGKGPRSKLSVVTATVKEMVAKARAENRGGADAKIFEQAAVEVEAKFKKEASTLEPQAKEDLQVSAIDLRGSADGTRLIGEKFDMHLFKLSIMGIESQSSGIYKARNDITAKKMNRENPNGKQIPSSQWAFGKYQFLSGTAAMYGVNFDSTNEDEIQAFLNNHTQQEELMNKLTLETLAKYSRQSEGTKQLFAKNGYSIYQILAAAHFGGAGKILWSKGEIRGGKGGGRTDWLGKTDMSAYLKKVQKTIDAETAKSREAIDINSGTS